MAKYSTLKELFTAIANSLRGKTGSTAPIVADDFPSVIDSLSTGGITPTGTKNITSNGTYDVTNFASALVNVAGLNARVFNATLSADVTSGAATLLASNEWIASIRSNPNAFVLMRYLGVSGSTAGNDLWFLSNFIVGYNGATAYKGTLLRQTAAALSCVYATNGLTADNYNGHLCVNSAGKVYTYPNATFPMKAGEYQIIAGTVEMI